MIDLDFILQRVSINWADARYAYVKGWWGWTHLVELAKHFNQLNEFCDLEYELAMLDKDQSWKVDDLLNQLADKVVCTEGEIKEKWLYISLSWHYFHKDTISDPLAEVEKIYADFDYPSEIESFVRYMPPTDGYDPTAHSYEDNIKRIMQNWQNYLLAKDAELKNRD